MSAQPTARRPGRSPGVTGNREAILAAARTLFARHGYGGATIRGIAREAGVDPALVMHYYGSKDGIFAAAIQDAIQPEEILAKVFGPGRTGMSHRLLSALLGRWDDPRHNDGLVAIFRSAMTHEHAAQVFREFVTERLLLRLARTIDAPRAELRATLAGSQVAGLVVVRYVLKVEPLASIPTEDVVTCLTPNIERLLAGDLGLEDSPAS